MSALRVAFLAAAAFIGAAAFAVAADPGEPAESCDGSTAEMVACANKKIAYWDQRLNAAYKKAIEIAQTEQREQLRVAQRLWLQYRHANCLYCDMGEGTIARIEAADCMLTMTEARTRELEANN
jgi:uncharacterized protein YecT (DUF1311 family)